MFWDLDLEHKWLAKETNCKTSIRPAWLYGSEVAALKYKTVQRIGSSRNVALDPKTNKEMSCLGKLKRADKDGLDTCGDWNYVNGKVWDIKLNFEIKTWWPERVVIGGISKLEVDLNRGAKDEDEDGLIFRIQQSSQTVHHLSPPPPPSHPAGLLLSALCQLPGQHVISRLPRTRLSRNVITWAVLL